MSLVIGAVNKRYICQENRFQENVCGICRDPFSLFNRVTRMPCGHIVHRNCFNELVAGQLKINEWGWPREGRQIKCIVCRTSFPIDVAAIRRLLPFFPVYAQLRALYRFDRISDLERTRLVPGDADKLEELLRMMYPDAESYFRNGDTCLKIVATIGTAIGIALLAIPFF